MRQKSGIHTRSLVPVAFAGSPSSAFSRLASETVMPAYLLF